MTDAQHEPPLAIGSTIGCHWSQYRLEEIEAENDTAVVYRAVPLQPVGYGHREEDVVGSTVFVVMLRRPLDLTIQSSTDRWQIAQEHMRRAMTMVDPSVAGFPEWNKIRMDDPVKLHQDEAGLIHWGAFQISTYRRRLAKLKAEFRRPKNFSDAVRRSLLKAANDRCQRCMSHERLELDHIIPIGLGGTNDQFNGMVLCSSCHLEKTRAERKAFGQSADSSQALRNHPKETFQDPLNYLQALQRISGWTTDLTGGNCT